jgi:hypothetical protein
MRIHANARTCPNSRKLLVKNGQQIGTRPAESYLEP